MVVFLDNKEKYNTAKMMRKIENQVSNGERVAWIRKKCRMNYNTNTNAVYFQIGVCVGLNKRLGELNEKLSTNPDYVSKVVLSNDDEGISSSKMSSIRSGHGLENL